jgi:hypothetical protein
MKKKGLVLSPRSSNDIEEMFPKYLNMSRLMAGSMNVTKKTKPAMGLSAS